MKELKVIVEISIGVEENEDVEGKYVDFLSELDNCGYNNGFSFKVVRKEIN